MILQDFRNAGSRSLASTETKWFNLSTRHLCPELKTLPENRDKVSPTKQARRELVADIVKRGAILEPILCDSNGNIFAGGNRNEIANELWDKGIDIVLGVTVNPLLDKYTTISERVGVFQSLNKVNNWTPEDRLKALVKDDNEYAEQILAFANEPTVYTKKGIYGIRSAFVAMGRNPNDFDTLPPVLGQQEYNISKQIFNETNRLLSLGIKKSDKANNWTEAFIKAWRRIRTNDAALQSEDENGDRTFINTKALNSKIEELGIDRIAIEWRSYADEAFSSGKTGRWARILETTIEETWKWEHRND